MFLQVIEVVGCIIIVLFGACISAALIKEFIKVVRK